MPEIIVRLKNGKYQVRNKRTGRIHSRGTTLAKAKAQVRLIMYEDWRKKRFR